jgi:hypothetical protein
MALAFGQIIMAVVVLIQHAKRIAAEPTGGLIATINTQTRKS